MRSISPKTTIFLLTSLLLFLAGGFAVWAGVVGQPTVQFTTSSVNVNQSDGTLVLTVQMTPSSANTVTVQYGTSNGMAMAPNDYTSTSGTLVFAPGETTKQITIHIVPNATGMRPASAYVTLSNAVNAMIGANGQVMFTINNGAPPPPPPPPPPPTVQYASSSYWVSESGGQVAITVTLSAPASGVVTVNYGTLDGSAIAGTDYVATSGLLTFAPGVTSQTFSVPIIDAGISGSSKTASLGLSNPSGATFGMQSMAILTIMDDDMPPPPPPTVQFDSWNYWVSESGGQAVITVMLGMPANGPVTVNYATSNGSAIAGTDYVATFGTLTIPAGVTSQSFVVPIIDAGVFGPEKTANLQLSAPTGATLGMQSTAVLTIMDNDMPPPPPPTVQFDSWNYWVSESAGQALITVTLSSPATGVVTVNYGTMDGSAIAGTDYVATSGVLTFEPGVTSQTFSIPIIDAGISGWSKTASLGLSNPSGATLGMPSMSMLTIMDDDMPPPPPPTVQFDSWNYSVSESGGQAVITVTLSAPTTGTVTVDYGTSDGSAINGTDYVGTFGSLTFAPGITSQTFSVPIIDAGIAGSSKTASLALSNPSGATLGMPSISMLTIMDDDMPPPPPPTVQFDSWNYTISESGGQAVITVTLSAPATGTVTVQYGTLDGSAIAGTDYVATAGQLTFAPGVTSQTFSVPIIDAGVSGPDKTASLGLSNPSGATFGMQSMAMLTIMDDDIPIPPTVQFDSSIYWVSESDGQALITVTLSAPASGPVTVNYTTLDGSAVAGLDYFATAGLLTFAPGVTSQIISVPIFDVGVFGPDKNASLQLSAPNGATLGTPSTAMLVIMDDDNPPPPPPPTVQFESSSYCVSESGGQVVVTVTLSAPATGPVTVDYATSDGSASAGIDFVATFGTLAFDVGDSGKTFVVPIINAGVSGPNKTANLQLSNPVGATSGTPIIADLTIVDDDPPPPPPPTVQFGSPTYIVSESEGQAIITVTLSGPANGPVTVNYATANGTAIAGTDYAFTFGTLTIAAGATSQTFVVPIIDAGVTGPNKTANLQLTAPTGATLGSPSTAVLTILDDDVPPPPSPPIDVTVLADPCAFIPSPAAVGDFVTATLSVKAARPSSSSISSPAWNWQYIGLESSDTSLAGPWSPATSTGFSIFSAPGSASDSTYDYCAVNVTTSFSKGAYYQMTFEAQVNYTDANSLCFFGKRRCVPQVIIVGVDKIIVQNAVPIVTGSTDMWLGDSITLQVLPTPANAPSWPAGWPQWTLLTKPNGSIIAPGGTPSELATITPDLKGAYTLQAACGGSTASFVLTAVPDTVTLTLAPAYVLVSPNTVAAAKRPSAKLTVELKGKPGNKANITLKSAGNGEVQFDTNPVMNVTVGTPQNVLVFGKTASNGLNGTNIEARIDPNAVNADDTKALTVVEGVNLYFAGNFECRLATDGNKWDEKRGFLGWETDTGLTISGGWTFALPPGNWKYGDKPKLPANYALPDVEPDLDRIIRFSSPVGKRSQLPAFVPVTVKKIVAIKPAGVEFTTGDSVIGLAVNLGPDNWFYGKDGDGFAPGMEPIANFKITVGNVLAGSETQDLPNRKAATAKAFVGNAVIANGVGGDPVVTQMLKDGLVAPAIPDLAAFRADRKKKLQKELADLNDAGLTTLKAKNLDFRIKNGIRGMNMMDIRNTFEIATNPKNGIPADKDLSATPGDSQALKLVKIRIDGPVGSRYFVVQPQFYGFDCDALQGRVIGKIRIDNP